MWLKQTRNIEVFLGWVLWLTSYVSVKGKVQVASSKGVLAQCGQPVTLTCDVTVHESPDPLNIKELVWLLNGSELCTLNESKVVDGCDTVSYPTNHSLILTVHGQPSSLGQYICKLRSNHGIADNTSNLTMQECFQYMTPSWTESELGCQFHGVYPAGTVHWFHGLENLTDSATTKMQQDQKGFFNINSTLNMSKPCNCSLWMPRSGRYLYTGEPERLFNVDYGKSSGDIVKLQWVLVSIGAIWQFLTSLPI